VSRIRFQVSRIRFQVSRIRFQVSRIRFQVSGVRFQVSGFLFLPEPDTSHPVPILDTWRLVPIFKLLASARLRTLGAILRTSLLTIGHADRIQRATNYVIADAW